MKIKIIEKGLLFIVLVIVGMFLMNSTVEAAPIKTTISEILASPDKYDSKMVQVEGKVTELFFKVSRKGNPYYTFKLTGEGVQSIKIFSFGDPPIKDGNSARVTGIFKKVNRVSGRVFLNEIDASNGKVEIIK